MKIPYSMQNTKNIDCEECHHPDDCEGCPESQRVPDTYKLKNGRVKP